ncbi:hypothetical protein [Denitromonas halophila]|uniref:GIY-YIG nuclease family protein n=1 Tax=Denitromonas halophila TaxID=1629404 RepID=A0A557R0P1_9RHOO|nr:hypothetical protein [Denitromonas halophila]TVO58720.1 hypothetical protein FHP91_03395 [Denitromonas halophila]
MFEERFSNWSVWSKRNELAGVRYPGIYVCAIGLGIEHGEPFSWRNEVVYIGMTNSKAGLKGRLQQFDRTWVGAPKHGGADRVRYKHQDYDALLKQLFVAVASFECSVTSNEPGDLRVMGEVAKFEYECMARFVEEHGELPEFNNKKASPKYSLTVARGS